MTQVDGVYLVVNSWASAFNDCVLAKYIYNIHIYIYIYWIYIYIYWIYIKYDPRIHHQLHLVDSHRWLPAGRCWMSWTSWSNGRRPWRPSAVSAMKNPSSKTINWLSLGYGSIPIDTIFSGMNIHLPAILGFTRCQGFDPSPLMNGLDL